MSAALASIITVSTLVKLVVGALVAGIGVTVAFSAVIYCVERAVAFRRADHRSAALAFQVASAFAVAAVIAIVTYGLILTTSKPR